MPPTPQTQYFTSVLLFGATNSGTPYLSPASPGAAGTVTGGTQYPVMPTCRLSVPKNFIVPPIIGNYFQLNYAEGLQQPVLDVMMVCRDVASEVLGSTFLNYFLPTGRSSAPAFDTPVISNGITFWDGATGFTMNGAKADSFTISCSKGSLVQFAARFVGTTLTGVSAAPSFTAWTLQNLFSFANVNFSAAPLQSTVWQYAISYSNNHTPDLSLNGSVAPAAQNAGMPTAGMQFTNQAQDTVVDNNPTTFTLGVPQFTSVTMSITGTNQTRNFVLNNPIDQVPRNRQVGVGRVMREHTYLCLAQDGQTLTTSPLTIS